MWLVFQARTTTPSEGTILLESAEIPVPVNIVGARMIPQKANPTHLNIHQDLLKQMQADGWELLPEGDGMWWERRLRRLKRKTIFGNRGGER